jgi:acetyltransferase-like isoleucine patch superfamily enzyme
MFANKARVAGCEAFPCRTCLSNYGLASSLLMRERVTTADFVRIAPDVRLGENVTIHGFVNLYGCEVGRDTRIGTFVEIQKTAKVGARCKISSHTFICEGVTIEDEVFIGHGVMFVNDPDPHATTEGRPQTDADWKAVPIRVCRGASIGSGAIVLAGVTIGAGALVGAGAVVTKDVQPDTVVAGCPARYMHMRQQQEERHGARP